MKVKGLVILFLLLASFVVCNEAMADEWRYCRSYIVQAEQHRDANNHSTARAFLKQWRKCMQEMAGK